MCLISSCIAWSNLMSNYVSYIHGDVYIKGCSLPNWKAPCFSRGICKTSRSRVSSLATSRPGRLPLLWQPPTPTRPHTVRNPRTAQTMFGCFLVQSSYVWHSGKCTWPQSGEHLLERKSLCNERLFVCVREGVYVSERLCVCVWERESLCERKTLCACKSVCVSERLCVCVRERVCVSERLCVWERRELVQVR